MRKVSRCRCRAPPPPCCAEHGRQLKAALIFVAPSAEEKSTLWFWASLIGRIHGLSFGDVELQGAMTLIWKDT
jgi:hypothetical protein